MGDTDQTGSTLQQKRQEADTLILQLNEFADSLTRLQVPGDAHQKFGQLREISKTITNLEGMKIPVPDELRNLKTDLFAETQHAEDTDKLLAFVELELHKLLAKVRETRGAVVSANGERRSHRRSEGMIPRDVLRECIMKVLKSHGGQAKAATALDEVGEILNGKLTPQDLEIDDRTSQPIWRRNTCFERRQMVREGILREKGEGGYWELNPTHKLQVQSK